MMVLHPIPSKVLPYPGVGRGANPAATGAWPAKSVWLTPASVPARPQTGFHSALHAIRI